jgi:hypothetical protein
MNKQQRTAIRRLKRKLVEVHGYVLTIRDEEESYIASAALRDSCNAIEKAIFHLEEVL